MEPVIGACALVLSFVLALALYREAD